MSRIVRSSKFRHVFGTVAKKEDCYDELKITRSAWDSNFVTASATHFAVCLEAGGGGAFAVVDYKNTGKFNPNAPVVTGHKGAVLDLDFNPFNDSLVASASEDCTVKVWGIPQGGLTENMTNPLQTLSGHKRKVGTIKFHPTANNVLASAGTDYSVKVWDVEKGTAVLNWDAQHTDIIGSLEWKYNGSVVVTSCKDKKLRLCDPRKGTTAAVRKKKNFFLFPFKKTCQEKSIFHNTRKKRKLDGSSHVMKKQFSFLFLKGGNFCLIKNSWVKKKHFFCFTGN